MNFTEKLNEILKVIHSRIVNFQPKLGIILGSGLGGLANEIKNPIIIPYEEIPHFPVSKVAGHSGKFIFGQLEGVPVVCLSGRVHLYEGHPLESIKLLIRTVQQLKCHTIIITNAAGSIRKEVKGGEVCMITDHINFTQINPLVGVNEDEFGPRFFPMTDAYDPDLRAKLVETAKEIGVTLYQGVYTATIGPSFETPAEVKMLRILGADLVGMSTIPEVLVAKHCGLKVLGISAVTNLAADISDVTLSHEHTLKYAEVAGEKLQKLVKAFLARHAKELNR